MQSRIGEWKVGEDKDNWVKKDDNIKNNKHSF